METLDRYRGWLDPQYASRSADLNKPLRAIAPRLFELTMLAGSGEDIRWRIGIWIAAWWVLVVGGLAYYGPRLELGFLLIALTFALLILGTPGAVIAAAASRGRRIAGLLGEPSMRVSAREIRPAGALEAHFSQAILRDATLQKGTLRLVRRVFHISVDSKGSRQIKHTDTTIDQTQATPGGVTRGQALELRADFPILPDAPPTAIGEKEHGRWFLVVDLAFAKMPPYQEMYEVVVLDGQSR